MLASVLPVIASLCTNQIPCNLLAVKQYPATLQLAQLALTDFTYLKSIFLCRSKTILKKFAVLLLATTILKSDIEEREGSTELAKCLQLALFSTLKSKEICKELFTLRQPLRKFRYRNRCRKGKTVS